jgi:two-component system, OmpR family, sensor kinase
MSPPEGAARRPTGLRLLARPAHWPVRWRLAGVSAGLTLIILIAFAAIVGRLATDRLRSDFEAELRGAASQLALEIELAPTGEFGQVAYRGPNLDEVARANDAAAQIVFATGQPIESTARVPEMGPPQPGIENHEDFDVATLPIVNDSGTPPAFIQYARDHDELDATVNRLWLLLVGGVVVGTALAAVAGLAVAGRAMRPIAELTATARQIASTRDPSQRIPEPERDDEVGELARTLDDMLRELDAARSETQQMMQAQREFIADASHELRTPLTSILANLELLHEELSEAERKGEQGEMVASALASSQRMRRLIADLLLLARADAGRPGTRREVDLSEVAEAAVAEVRPVADGHRLELHAADGVSVDADPDELHRLAVNLLDNGLRHTPAGSTIEIAVARRNGDAVLEVSDDGPGIPADERDQVFSRFARMGGPADVVADSGTGLGLAIVRAVATGHGGAVEAGDSPTGGARFTVTLPPAGSGRASGGRSPEERPAKS